MTRRVAGLIVCLLLLGGCTNHRLEQQKHHSLAYNIVTKGNLPSSFASDSSLNSEQQEQIQTLLTLPAAQDNHATKPPAFTQWQALNQVLASSSVSTDEVTLLAWVPSYRSDNRAAARKAMIKQIDRAVRQAFADISAEHSDIEGVTIQRMDDVVFRYRVNSAAEWHCPSCALEVRINTPLLARPPYFVRDSAPTKVYVFGYQPKSVASLAIDERRNYLAIQTSANAYANSADFLARVSWRLPPWMFIAVPAGITQHQGQTLDFAYVLREGQPLLFVRP